MIHPIQVIRGWTAGSNAALFLTVFFVVIETKSCGREIASLSSDAGANAKLLLMGANSMRSDQDRGWAAQSPDRTILSAGDTQQED